MHGVDLPTVTLRLHFQIMQQRLDLILVVRVVLQTDSFELLHEGATLEFFQLARQLFYLGL